MKQTSSIIVILIFLIISITACTPSSSSIRYGKEKEIVVADIDSSVRFTSLNDNLLKDSLVIDSVCCDDIESELNDPDDMPDEEDSVDILSIMTQLNSGSNEYLLSVDQSSHRERVIMEIIKYMNTPYKFGGNSIKGIDCSAFTQTVYREALSIEINRSAREQYKQGEVVTDKSELKFGDLVFFNTRRRIRPGHVGIYIGDNLFAHASTKRGVTISSMDHNYYSARYMGARRLDNSGLF